MPLIARGTYKYGSQKIVLNADGAELTNVVIDGKTMNGHLNLWSADPSIQGIFTDLSFKETINGEKIRFVVYFNSTTTKATKLEVVHGDTFKKQ